MLPDAAAHVCRRYPGVSCAAMAAVRQKWRILHAKLRRARRTEGMAQELDQVAEGGRSTWPAAGCARNPAGRCQARRRVEATLWYSWPVPLVSARRLPPPQRAAGALGDVRAQSQPAWRTRSKKRARCRHLGPREGFAGRLHGGRKRQRLTGGGRRAGTRFRGERGDSCCPDAPSPSSRGTCISPRRSSHPLLTPKVLAHETHGLSVAQALPGLLPEGRFCPPLIPGAGRISPQLEEHCYIAHRHDSCRNETSLGRPALCCWSVSLCAACFPRRGPRSWSAGLAIATAIEVSRPACVMALYILPPPRARPISLCTRPPSSPSPLAAAVLQPAVVRCPHSPLLSQRVLGERR